MDCVMRWILGCAIASSSCVTPELRSIRSFAAGQDHDRDVAGSGAFIFGEKGHLRGLLIEQAPPFGPLRHLSPDGKGLTSDLNRRLRMREQVVIPVGMGGFTPF